MPWTRRHFLVTCPIITTITGCQNVFSQKPNARLAWLWFLNDRQEAVTASVTIRDEEEKVYESRVRLDGPDSTRFTPAPTITTGVYTVAVDTDGRFLRVATWDFVDREEPCIGLRFMFLNNGEFDWTYRTMRRCDSSAEAEVNE